MMRIVLAGQPNSGKSTLLNQVAGYRQITSNFLGKTVTYFLSKVNVAREVVEVYFFELFRCSCAYFRSEAVGSFFSISL